MNKKHNFFLVFISIILLLHFTACSDDGGADDGTVTITITGIDNGDIDGNGDGQQIVTAIYERASDPSTSTPLCGYIQDCSDGAGTYTITLKVITPPITITAETWEGDGGEKYDFYAWLDGDVDKSPDTSGVDYRYREFPIVIEIDGDLKLTLPYSDFDAMP
ncbi:MAG: hypothetical protein RBT69_13550 [Spirochaetia bacterium]|jgi:hypothetical protein|nr:hypothetical protein [Spirochaetia bacterium]